MKKLLYFSFFFKSSHGKNYLYMSYGMKKKIVMYN